MRAISHTSRSHSSRLKKALSLSRRSQILLEALEPRALLSGVTIVNAKTATFTDVDGDLVTVAVTKGTLTSGLFITASSGLGEQLQELDLPSPTFSGTNLTISVKQVGTGDGLTNVGYINASGNSMGKTIISGDLGRIDAGANTKSGVASLSVFSMGRQGTSSQEAGGNLVSNITTLGSLAVTTDINQAFINVTGNIGSVRVGGSLIGGTDANSGSIESSTGNIGNVFVGQNLAADNDIAAASADHSASIFAYEGSMGNVTIIGSLLGGAAYGTGDFYSYHNMGKVFIGGSLIGGSGEYSGEFDAFTISSATVNGSLMGGSGDSSGSILMGSVGNVAIGGSVIGGAGADSGAIYTKFSDNGNMGKVTISQNLVGGDYNGADSSFTGYVEATGKIASIFVGGNVVAGNNTGGGTLESGTIRAGTTIGSVQINGNLIGSATQDAIIAAGAGGKAIGSVLIGGRVDHGQILAGYITNDSDTTNMTTPIGALAAANGGAQIGKITVAGDWIASTVMAGTAVGLDTLPGTVDDIPIASAGSGKGAIASITIFGQVFGTADAGDHFGFISSSIGSFSEAGIKAILTKGKDNILIGGTDDVTILEV